MELKTLSNLGRFRDVGSVLIRYGFDDLVARLELPGMGVLRRIKNHEAELTPYQRIRHTLEELGPTFVKFGQVMSIRPDLLPVELIRELQQLQDDVAPLPFEKIREVVEAGLNRPLEYFFSHFEEQPTAAASLSQVHRAVLKENGLVVAAKVQRPGIRGIIRTDLNILDAIARRIHQRIEGLRVYDLPNIVRVTRRTLLRELDFTREARNMRIARSYLEKGGGIYIPEVHFDYCTEKILIMEFAQGTRLKEVNPSTLSHPEHLAAAGLRSAIKQILEDGFFHADPHPGNLLLTDDENLCLLDWGMVGRLTERDRLQLIDLIDTVVEKDSRRLAGSLLAMTFNSGETNRPALERDLLELLDAFYSVPLKELNLGHLLLDITSLLREHALRLPADLVIMIKALVTAEGTARGIYPELNVVAEAEDKVRRLAAKRYRPGVMWRELRLTLSQLWNLSQELPGRVTRIMDKMDKGELHIKFEHENLDGLRSTLDNSSNRLTFGVIIGSMIIGSSMIITTGVRPLLFGFPLLGILGYLVSGVLGLWLVFNIIRSRRY
ncbi:MAG: ABC1 kinase family protein [Desulfobacteraceae bacterium]